MDIDVIKKQVDQLAVYLPDIRALSVVKNDVQRFEAFIQKVEQFMGWAEPVLKKIAQDMPPEEVSEELVSGP